MNAFAKIRKALNTGDANDLLTAMDALAELERAAAQPVAYQYAHPHFGGGKIWREEQRWNGHTSDEARALYAAPPAPVAEIREPSDAECENIWLRFQDAPMFANPAMSGRAMFDAVSAVMRPKSEAK